MVGPVNDAVVATMLPPFSGSVSKFVEMCINVRTQLEPVFFIWVAVFFVVMLSCCLSSGESQSAANYCK